jgi:hypothetical protein
VGVLRRLHDSGSEYGASGGDVRVGDDRKLPSEALAHVSVIESVPGTFDKYHLIPKVLIKQPIRFRYQIYIGIYYGFLAT